MTAHETLLAGRFNHLTAPPDDRLRSTGRSFADRKGDLSARYPNCLTEGVALVFRMLQMFSASSGRSPISGRALNSASWSDAVSITAQPVTSHAIRYRACIPDCCNAASLLTIGIFPIRKRRRSQVCRCSRQTDLQPNWHSSGLAIAPVDTPTPQPAPARSPSRQGRGGPTPEPTGTSAHRTPSVSARFPDSRRPAAGRHRARLRHS